MANVNMSGSESNIPRAVHYSKTRNLSNLQKDSENQRDGSSARSSSSREYGNVLTVDTEQFIIGQRVWVGGTSPGQIAYIGETHFAPGEWAGIVLDEPIGKNDGCVGSKRYFQCEPRKGIFSRLTKLTLHPLENATKKVARSSPERSLTVSPTPSTPSLFSKSVEKRGISVGDRVIISSGLGSRPGTLKFIGETKFASGTWCGIELDEPTGKNDGSVDGVKYFECECKYGIFVPIAKVSLSPSSKKSRLSRACSRDSLNSICTLNSVATTNTSRLRMQQKTPLKKPVPITKNSFSMQDLLKEKQNHIEQLTIEREMDLEYAQNQALQYQKTISELKAQVASLEGQLNDEKCKTEDLRLAMEEVTFCGDELNAQTLEYKERIDDLEQKLHSLSTGSPLNQSEVYTSNLSSSRISLPDCIEAIKDLIQQNPFLQDKLGRYLEVNKYTEDDTSNKFLNDISESLVHTIKKLTVTETNNRDLISKCENIETILTAKDEEIKRINSERNIILENLNSAKVECKDLSANNDQLKITLEAELERLRSENSDILMKLNNISSELNDSLECNKKLEQQLLIGKEQIDQLEVEKLTTSINHNDVVSSCSKLSDLNDTLQHKLRDNDEMIKRLELEKIQLSCDVHELTSNNKMLSETCLKLQDDVKNREEEIKQLKTEKFEISHNLEDVTKKYETLSSLNDKIQQELTSQNKTIQVDHSEDRKRIEMQLKNAEDKLKQLEIENLNISSQFDVLTANYNKASQLNEKFLEELKSHEDKNKSLTIEKFSIISELDDIKSKCNNVTEINGKLQDDLKANQDTISQHQLESLKLQQDLHNTKFQQEHLMDQFEKEKKDKSNIISEFEELKIKYKEVAEANDRLTNDLRSNIEKVSLLHDENQKISRDLQDIKSNYEESLNRCEMEKLEKTNITSELEVTKSKYKDMLDAHEKLQNDLKSIQEISSQLQVENQKLLHDLQATRSNYDDLIQKYAQEKETPEEKEEISNIGREFESIKSKYKFVSDANDQLQADLKTNHETISQLRAENLNISQDLLNLKHNYEELIEKYKQEKSTAESVKEIDEEYEDSENLKDTNAYFDALFDSLTLFSLQEQGSNRIEKDMPDDVNVNTELESDLHAMNEKIKSDLKLKDDYFFQLELSRTSNKTTVSGDVLNQLKEIIKDFITLCTLINNSESEVAINDNNPRNPIVNCDDLFKLNKKLQAQLIVLKHKLNDSESESEVANCVDQIVDSKIPISESDPSCVSTWLQNLYLHNQIQKIHNIFKSLSSKIETLNNNIPSNKECDDTDSEIRFDFIDLVHNIDTFKQTYKKFNSHASPSSLEIPFTGIANHATTFLKANIWNRRLQGRAVKTLVPFKLSITLSSLQFKHFLYTILYDLEKTDVLKAQNYNSFKNKSDDSKLIDSELYETLKTHMGQTRDLERRFRNLTHAYFKLMSIQRELRQLHGTHVTSHPETNYNTYLEYMKQLDERIYEAGKAITPLCSKIEQFVQNSIASIINFGKETDGFSSNINAISIQHLTKDTETLLNTSLYVLSTFSQKLAELKSTNVQCCESLNATSHSNDNKQPIITNQVEQNVLPTIPGSNLHEKKKSALPTPIATHSTGAKPNTLSNRAEDKEVADQCPDAHRLSETDMKEKVAQIKFLNSIISDMQNKNDDLQAKIKKLESYSGDMLPFYFFKEISRKPAPRKFCDICDQFDLHETEDCPLQESDRKDSIEELAIMPGSKKNRILPEPRKYCETCEAFGNHTTEECFGGLE